MTSAGVVVLTGPPCSGKSSVGGGLVRLWPADPPVYVEVDSLFLQLLPNSDRNRHDRMLAYDAAHALARTVLDHGRTPVLECTYARRDQRASLMNAFADVPVWVVEFAITPDDAVQRFRGRAAETDLDEQLLRERVETFPYTDDALRLTPSTPDDLAAQIKTWLEEEPPPVDPDRWVASGLGWMQ